MRLLSVFLLFPVLLSAQKKENRTVFTNTKTYEQVIAEFSAIDQRSDNAALLTSGTTDGGNPLHVFVLSADHNFTAASAKANGKCVIMINNAIHPGEPDGVDASIELAKTYTANPALLPANVVLVIIPVYNVDGYLNRGKHSRANQNGPIEYGFRGNALNLDLNRDFIKADSKNTISFHQIFQQWKPDILIDNHVSDGADYQYTMTLIATQRNKLHPIVSAYMDKKLVPALYAGMAKRGTPICPYVDTWGETPESGLVGFLETPRFATGYAALFNCIGFVPETHMLKPYNDRVWATYDLMITLINQAASDGAEIVRLHREADEAVKTQREYVLAWRLDTTKYDLIDFKGYESTHVISKISGLPVLYYDQKKPYTKKIRYYNTYMPAKTVHSAEQFIIPQAWSEVIMRLQVNGVVMKRLVKDTVIATGCYVIQSTTSPPVPYESHYNHTNTTTTYRVARIQYFAGDYVIELNQTANRYIVEVLEPGGNDSFFAWNFFDGILSQKEWFSDYVFDQKAEEQLVKYPHIREELEAAKQTDTALANSHWLQMNFIYQRSEYKEPTHNRYPVGMLARAIQLPVTNE